MHFVFFLEEPSAEEALKALLPSYLGSEHTCRYHVHPGKQHLLKNLLQRLRGYPWAPADWRFVVLLDRDREDCHRLKCKLEDLAATAGLPTPSRSDPHRVTRLINRIAVAELEAWFLGDPEALRAAFPNVSKSFERKMPYRNPDRVADPARRLERLLQGAGHYPGGLAKIDAARRIGPHLDPSRNRSRSFRTFCAGIEGLLEANPG